MDFSRDLDLDKYDSSVFLLGPRMTGKSYLLERMQSSVYFDLLDPEQEISYQSNPKKFYEELLAIAKGSTVIVDEIQRVPSLLDYVQIGIEKLGLRFVLSGSSARKLKREATNLLAGRALLFHLHPLSFSELGEHFDIDSVLRYGSLPKVSSLITEEKLDEARQLLRTYSHLYLKEEIQQEAISRNIGNFTRFLQVSAQFNAQRVVYKNIATSSGTPRSTVSHYFDILEDTLIGTRLWEYGKSEKDKSKPKFYFFDCGVLRALQDRLYDPPTPDELGHLFESFFFHELRKIRDYRTKPHSFSFWNDKHEIDFLIEKGGQVLAAFECKTNTQDIKLKDFKKFQEQFPDVPIIIVSLKDERPRELSSSIKIMPWKDALEYYSARTFIRIFLFS